MSEHETMSTESSSQQRKSDNCFSYKPIEQTYLQFSIYKLRLNFTIILKQRRLKRVDF